MEGVAGDEELPDGPPSTERKGPEDRQQWSPKPDEWNGDLHQQQVLDHMRREQHTIERSDRRKQRQEHC
jgi:hypothetical protein